MKNNSGLYIGTSGWSYDSWRGVFYPEDMGKSKYLEHYAACFPTVEIATTYFQMPQASAFSEFAQAVPDSFIFSVKANRYITHIKRLKDGRSILPPFLNRLENLKEKMGPILLQIPPNWSFNRERLKSFLEAMPQNLRFVFEFHHPSWHNDSTYELLAQKNAALGIFQVGERITPKISTSDFIYIHISQSKVKSSRTIPNLLEDWIGPFGNWSAAGKDIFCYFQGEDNSAIADALHFRDGIEKAIGTGRRKRRVLEKPGISKDRISKAA